MGKLTDEVKEKMRIVRENISDEDSNHLIDMNTRHYDEYKFFTRLLLSLSTGSIVMLVSLNGLLDVTGWLVSSLYIISLTLLLLSSISGVFLQQEMLMRYIYSTNRVFDKYDDKLDDRLRDESTKQLEADNIANNL